MLSSSRRAREESSRLSNITGSPLLLDCKVSRGVLAPFLSDLLGR
nr:hypothetical protein [Streptomyces sp. 13-12-16]